MSDDQLGNWEELDLRSVYRGVGGFSLTYPSIQSMESELDQLRDINAKLLAACEMTRDYYTLKNQDYWEKYKNKYIDKRWAYCSDGLLHEVNEAIAAAKGKRGQT